MQQCPLSQVTKAYLAQFYSILDEMITGMTNAELGNSISQNFIRQMIPHHRAAIEMSRNILQYTTNLDLERIATNIIAEQTKSIADMEAVESSCGNCENTDQDLFLYQRRFTNIIQTMFAGMERAAADNNVSADFVREMIPHHEGAVQMSKNALCFSICPALRPILEAIITSQTRGIRQMQSLLRCLTAGGRK